MEADGCECSLGGKSTVEAESIGNTLQKRVEKKSFSYHFGILWLVDSFVDDVRDDAACLLLWNIKYIGTDNYIVVDFYHYYYSSALSQWTTYWLAKLHNTAKLVRMEQQHRRRWSLQPSLSLRAIGRLLQDATEEREKIIIHNYICFLDCLVLFHSEQRRRVFDDVDDSENFPTINFIALRTHPHQTRHQQREKQFIVCTKWEP